MTDIKKLFKEHKPEFHISTDDIDYQQLYEQQKLRADRAEKRWENLKEHFNKEKEQSFSILSWSRNNGMLELMEQLEEDGE